ncbi:heterokaryon incompatibility protein-domain-containing protein [Aspergillus ambiguus]|uniref:heterokaryon incompatibility protein-domain-containing protein n=1 Tax=Aspergillus ambiguus TaxID=176160 RepID=UPI003CCDB6DD
MKEFFDESMPEYAILSHTWGGEEVSYRDLLDRHCAKSGYDKIEWCCSVAKADSISWAWVDTCCIDQTSSAELTEAINSMYRWYQGAKVCYVLLSDVPSKPFTESRWFTRGWTLQELIAPKSIIFFDGNWQAIGTKNSLRNQITECTKIPLEVLSGSKSLLDISVAQRMSWASKRRTSRIEDRAYSLLGIFDIHMPLIYGEGYKAFTRLQEEIMRVFEDYTIFAWKADLEPGAYGGLLAPSPDAFANSSGVVSADHLAFRTRTTWTVNNRGIQLELPFMGIGPQKLGLALLNCKDEPLCGQQPLRDSPPWFGGCLTSQLRE